MEQYIEQTESSVFTRRRSDDYLEDLYDRLEKFEDKLDEFLSRSDTDLREIGAVTGYINNLRNEISQIEAERRQREGRKPDQQIYYDNQTVISTSSVRRKTSIDLVKLFDK